MRVTIVNPVWDQAVATTVATLERFTTLSGWAEAVRSNGATAVAVCQRFSSDDDVERNGVHYRFRSDRRRSSPLRTTRGSKALLDAILETDADIVHINGLLFPELIRSVRAALPERVALVVQDHGGFDPSQASAFTRVWLRRGLAAADAVLVASAGQAEEMRASGIAPRETLIADVMESSTSLRATSRSRSRAELHMHGNPSLLWVGRLNENKDPLTVLRGVSAFIADHPQTTMTMAFQGGELDRAVRAAVAADPLLRSRVSLIGAVPHDRLAAYYSAADFFLLGSRHEGSGYAALEALACGCVPVVTDIAPFRALTDDGAVGELWAPGRADACTAALHLALARPAERRRDAVRDRFEREFSWSKIGARAVAVYREVIAARGRARSSVRVHSTR